MRIGELAGASGVPAKTIRFWEERRMLAPPSRTPAGYRTYDRSIVDRLAFIRRAQAAGFRLDEIRQVLEIGDSGSAPCQHVRELIDGRLAEVEARIAELDSARRHLRELARRAAGQDPAECHGYCSILQPEPVAAGTRRRRPERSTPGRPPVTARRGGAGPQALAPSSEPAPHPRG